jgi:hypothetical protein
MLKRRLLSGPLLHFLVLGAAVFGLSAVTSARRGESAGSQEIVVSAGRVQSLVETFSRQCGRPPSMTNSAG